MNEEQIVKYLKRVMQDAYYWDNGEDNNYQPRMEVNGKQLYRDLFNLVNILEKE